jgi:prepilin-type N-terminal cleavage/methylation domain-containing protein
MFKRGFAIIEFVITLAILGVLTTISFNGFVAMRHYVILDGGIQELSGVLRLAQSRALASDQQSKYGVYLNSSLFPNSYVLFKGPDYQNRESAYDQNYWLPSSLEFSAIDLGGGNEIIFDRITGMPMQSGSLTIRLRVNPPQEKTIHIASSGVIGFTNPANSSDANRIKDSRHVHANYSRIINTTSENITLTFNGNVVQSIPINQNMIGGKIDWSGSVVAGGSSQKIRLYTHYLNDAVLGTQFSIHRDRRFNDKTFKINISGDNSGSIIEYSADGMTTNFGSAYVSNLAWQ